jgi:hypothetical protein
MCHGDPHEGADVDVCAGTRFGAACPIEREEVVGHRHRRACQRRAAEEVDPHPQCPLGGVATAIGEGEVAFESVSLGASVPPLVERSLHRVVGSLHSDIVSTTCWAVNREASAVG